MFRWVFAVLTLFSICAIVSAQCATQSYSSVPTYAPTQPYRETRREEHHDNFIRVILADAVFPIIDLTARDIFYLGGAPLAVPATLTLGVNASGQEVTSAQAQTPAASNTAGGLPAPLRSALPVRKSIRDVITEDESPESSAISSAPSNLGSLPERAIAVFKIGACGACHTAGSARGKTTLMTTDGKLASGIDWAKVIAYTTPDEASHVGCPQNGRGRVLTAENRGVFSEFLSQKGR